VPGVRTHGYRGNEELLEDDREVIRARLRPGAVTAHAPARAAGVSGPPQLMEYLIPAGGSQEERAPEEISPSSAHHEITVEKRRPADPPSRSPRAPAPDQLQAKAQSAAPPSALEADRLPKPRTLEKIS